MRRHGFQFVGLWETTPERTKFVYVLAWPSEGSKDAAWATFMADAEWKDIKRVTAAQHGDLVGAIEDRILHSTGYGTPSRHDPA